MENIYKNNTWNLNDKFKDVQKQLNNLASQNRDISWLNDIHKMESNKTSTRPAQAPCTIFQGEKIHPALTNTPHYIPHYSVTFCRIPTKNIPVDSHHLQLQDHTIPGPQRRICLQPFLPSSTHSQRPFPPKFETGKKNSKLATLYDFQFFTTPPSTRRAFWRLKQDSARAFQKASGACPERVLKSVMRILLPELELHNTSSCSGKMPADILELPLCSLQRGRDDRDPCLPSSTRRRYTTAVCPRLTVIVRGADTFSC